MRGFERRTSVEATELVAPGEAITPGQVYDSNATILAAAVAEQGGEPVCLGIAADDAPQLEALLSRAIAEHSMVLLSGGSDAGQIPELGCRLTGSADLARLTARRSAR